VNSSVAQGVLPFKYEAEKNRSGMTALAGLPTYLELASVCGLQASIDRHLGECRCGRVRTKAHTAQARDVGSRCHIGGDPIKPKRSCSTSIFARISRSTRIGPSMTSCCIRGFATATFRPDSSNCACSGTRWRCCPTLSKRCRCVQTPPAIRPNCLSIVPKGRTPSARDRRRSRS
jgi:hypothetical protein